MIDLPDLQLTFSHDAVSLSNAPLTVSCHMQQHCIYGVVGDGEDRGNLFKKCLKHTAFHEFLPGTSMATAVNCSYKNMCKAFAQ